MELVADGYRSIDTIDISQGALDTLQDRLRERFGDGAAAGVRWVRADVREVSFDHPVDVWHDRATFHFLTDPADQTAYAQRAAAAVQPGGWLVMATFAPDGPQQCSGLFVARHSAESLANVLTEFELTETFEQDHVTPWGTPQRFTHALLHRHP